MSAMYFIKRNSMFHAVEDASLVEYPLSSMRKFMREQGVKYVWRRVKHGEWERFIYRQNASIRKDLLKPWHVPSALKMYDLLGD